MMSSKSEISLILPFKIVQWPSIFHLYYGLQASLFPFSLSVHSAPGSWTPSMLLEHAKSKGFTLCLCLEHFHTFPAFSFSSTDLCSNENYQRHFLTTPFKVPFSIFPLPLRIVFFRAFLTISYLTHLFIISFPP